MTTYVVENADRLKQQLDFAFLLDFDSPMSSLKEYYLRTLHISDRFYLRECALKIFQIYEILQVCSDTNLHIYRTCFQLNKLKVIDVCSFDQILS